jgi:hypothetical protein
MAFHWNYCEDCLSPNCIEGTGNGKFTGPWRPTTNERPRACRLAFQPTSGAFVPVLELLIARILAGKALAFTVEMKV